MKQQDQGCEVGIMQEKVLFLCTGNYYRSRFAEHLFNHEAARRGLNWTADSRGLAIELGVNNVGPLSKYTLAGLRERGIALDAPFRFPQQVQEADLQAAALIIALDRAEHQPYVALRWPTWLNRVHYWEVADMHLMTAADALGKIEAQVMALLDQCELRQGRD